MSQEDKIIALLEENNRLLRSFLESDDKEYLTISEVAEKLRKHPGTVRRWISEHRLKAKKLNNGVRQDRYLVHRDEVTRLLTVRKGGRIGKNRST